jgi:hypothetical protein
MRNGNYKGISVAAFDTTPHTACPYRATVNEILYLPEQIRLCTYFRVTKLNFASPPPPIMHINMKMAYIFTVYIFILLNVPYQRVLGLENDQAFQLPMYSIQCATNNALTSTNDKSLSNSNALARSFQWNLNIL